MTSLHPADVSLSKTPKSPCSSGSGLPEPSLTTDLPVEGGRQKEILPMGINKVPHYHLNAADCIFVSLHFSPRSKRVIWPCHGRSAVSVGEKVCRPKCQMIKEQPSTSYASYLSVRLSAFKRQFITMSHLRSSLLRLLYHVCWWCYNNAALAKHIKSTYYSVFGFHADIQMFPGRKRHKMLQANASHLRVHSMQRYCARPKAS